MMNVFAEFSAFSDKRKSTLKHHGKVDMFSNLYVNEFYVHKRNTKEKLHYDNCI